MKIKEIHVKHDGTLGTKEYNNRKPGSYWVATLNGKETSFEGAKHCYYEIKDFLVGDYEKDKQLAMVERVRELFKDIKFGNIYHKDLSAHVRASSVEAYAFPIPLEKPILAQYSARGNIIHELIKIFLTGGPVKEWVDPKTVPKLAVDLNILKNGILKDGSKLSYHACSHMQFFDKYQDDIDFDSDVFLLNHVVRDDKSMTCGEADFIAPFQKKLSLIDFKTGGWKWHRMAFYFKHCGYPVEQMVIFPLKPTDNKAGYCKPSIIDNKKDIDKYYEAFMVQRENLRETFNV